MIPYRKCLIFAVFLLLCLSILHLSTSSTVAQRKLRLVVDSGAKLESSSETTQRKDASTAPPNQIPFEDLIRKPLRERLRFQFPYDIQSKFPAYVWQTWKYTPASRHFRSDLRPYEASWTEAHPGFVHQVITDDGGAYVIRYLYAAFPEIIEAFESMPLPVLKADFFRYLILLARGGIYSDIDTWALKPATEWVPSSVDRSSIGIVIGIEADPDRPDWKDWYSRRIQFCQWTIQSKPGHPILREVVVNITEEALRMKEHGKLKKSKMDKSIVEFTGPAVWTDAVFNYFNNPNYYDIGKGFNSTETIDYKYFTGIVAQKVVGDVVVLPITSFSPGVRQMGAEEPEHPMAFVKHEFQGEWKSSSGEP